LCRESRGHSLCYTRARIIFRVKIACGGGRGTGKPRGKKKQQSQTASPARKQRKLVEIQSSKEACATSS